MTQISWLHLEHRQVGRPRTVVSLCEAGQSHPKLHNAPPYWCDTLHRSVFEHASLVFVTDESYLSLGPGPRAAKTTLCLWLRSLPEGSRSTTSGERSGSERTHSGLHTPWNKAPRPAPNPSPLGLKRPPNFPRPQGLICRRQGGDPQGWQL